MGRQLSAQEVSEKHNATLPPKNHNSAGQLKAYVERFEKLAEAAQEIRDDVKELAAEAKGNGFDPAAIKAIVKERMEDAEKKAKRAERETLIDTYKASLGMLD